MKKWLLLVALMSSLVSANEITDFLDALDANVSFVYNFGADKIGTKTFNNNYGETKIRYWFSYNNGELFFEAIPENILNLDNGLLENRSRISCRFTPNMKGIIRTSECDEYVKDLIASLKK